MLGSKTIELAKGKNFAVLSTIMPSGHPQSQMVWIDSDGENIIFNTEIDRAKFKNIQRNPLVTVLIMEAGNNFSWCEIRGHVCEIVRGEEARDHIDTLAGKYLGVEEYPNPIGSERVLVKIAPDRVFEFPPAPADA
jgi:PPOX class probable F420-dependent enzyme